MTEIKNTPLHPTPSDVDSRVNDSASNRGSAGKPAESAVRDFEALINEPEAESGDSPAFPGRPFKQPKGHHGEQAAPGGKPNYAGNRPDSESGSTHTSTPRHRSSLGNEQGLASQTRRDAQFTQTQGKGSSDASGRPDGASQGKPNLASEGSSLTSSGRAQGGVVQGAASNIPTSQTSLGGSSTIPSKSQGDVGQAPANGGQHQGTITQGQHSQAANTVADASKLSQSTNTSNEVPVPNQPSKATVFSEGQSASPNDLQPQKPGAKTDTVAAKPSDGRNPEKASAITNKPITAAEGETNENELESGVSLVTNRSSEEAAASNTATTSGAAPAQGVAPQAAVLTSERADEVAKLATEFFKELGTRDLSAVRDKGALQFKLGGETFPGTSVRVQVEAGVTVVALQSVDPETQQFLRDSQIALNKELGEGVAVRVEERDQQSGQGQEQNREQPEADDDN